MVKKSKLISIGIVGTGQFAKKHLKIWQKFKNVKIVGYYSHHNSIINNLKKYQNLNELIKDSDLIDIVTQNYLYYEVIKKILRYKKNFIVEKPFSVNLKEVKYLEKKLINYKKNCFSIFQYRFNKNYYNFLKDKQNFKKENITSINIEGYYFRNENYYNKNNKWRKLNNKSGGGVLIMQGIHITDILFQKFGYNFNILKVNKIGEIAKNIEQSIFIDLEYKNFPVYLKFTTKFKKEIENIEVKTKKYFFDINKYGIFKSKLRITNKLKVMIIRILFRIFNKKYDNDLHSQFTYIISAYRRKKLINRSSLQNSINTMKSIINIYNY